jgi:hypothetical protein
MRRVLFGVFAAMAVLFASCEDAVSGIPGANETETDEPGTDLPGTETAATPVASPGAGAVPAGTPVTLSTVTEGAVIYYTVDGADPASSGALYAAPVVIDTAKTVRAVAKKSGMADSGILIAAYTVDDTMAAVPGASVDTGTYSAAQSVTLTTATSGGSIYYTVDGSVPSATNGTLYSGPVAITVSATLKAVTVKDGLTDSPVMVKEYTLKAAKPTASVPGGSYSAAQSVALTTATGGAVIYYTTNGSAPSASSTPYTGAVTVGEGTTTLKAVAVKSGWTASDVLTETYTVTLPTLPPDPEPPAQSEPEGNFTIVANSTGVTITAYNKFAKDMVIPATIEGQPVTVIGANAFKGKFLTSVYIPPSVTAIGASAFEDNQLASVHIPQAVTAIGNDAFANNPFTRITVGTNADRDVITGAFSEESFSRAYWFYGGAGTYTRGSGNWAKGIQIQAGDYWYTGMSGGRAAITGYAGSGPVVGIPGTFDGQQVTAIGSNAFKDKQLTGVTIPNGVTVIGQDAFADNLLAGVTIPDSVTGINSGAFANNQLTSVTIGSGVTTLSGFGGNQLTSVTIPNSVTYINPDTFANNQLTSVTIGNKVTTIGYSAFSGNQLKSVTIPDSVTEIGGFAFSENQLTSVTIGNGVTVIGISAFAKNQLTSVTIGNKVTTIGSSAFSNNKLTSVTIPNSVATIGDSAFSDNQLTSVTIPAGVSLTYAFPGNFETVYTTTNNKAAGTYTASGSGSSTTWTKSQ